MFFYLIPIVEIQNAVPLKDLGRNQSHPDVERDPNRNLGNDTAIKMGFGAGRISGLDLVMDA